MRRPSDTGRMRYVNRLFGVVNMFVKRRYMAAAERQREDDIWMASEDCYNVMCNYIQSCTI